MQITTATPNALAATIQPGDRLATATNARTGAPVEITAGRVLRTGVTDIRETGWELIMDTHGDMNANPSGKPTTWGMVGFVRTGDAWTAVELLQSTPTGPERMWLPYYVKDVQLAPGIQLDAAWQVSHYGGDYSDKLHGWFAPTPKPVTT